MSAAVIPVIDREHARAAVLSLPVPVTGAVREEGRHQFLAHTDLLTFEEIERLVRIFVKLGIEKVRLTGGEPLLRKNVDVLVHKLKGIRTRQGQPLDVAMTTNATLLARMAGKLKAAGLNRVTVSLDALSEPLFQSINDVGFPAAKVLEGIDAASAAALH